MALQNRKLEHDRKFGVASRESCYLKGTTKRGPRSGSEKLGGGTEP